MAAAAVRGALENVAINLESMADAGTEVNFIAAMRAEAASLETRIAENIASTTVQR